MKNSKKIKLFVGAGALVSFAIWTVLLFFVDRAQIGPNGSSVGFAKMNQYVHGLTGVNMAFYTITDWLGLVPIFVSLAFALLGLSQWIKRKRLVLVDKNIIALGIFYVIVIAAYILFENVIVNYRPVLIDGLSEVSYPSSTTMLVTCVMPTAIIQLKDRFKESLIKRCIIFLTSAFTAFMVIGRLISGVHWLSDIIGGLLLSTGLVYIYGFFHDRYST